MNVAIQSARIDDAAAIAWVHMSSLRAAYEDQVPDHVLDVQDVKPRARHWEGWLRRTQVSTFLARVDGVVTGFCTLHPTHSGAAPGMTGEVPALFVLPSHWRRGIGRLLCEETLAEASTRGFAEVVLWVLESNERARLFYESLGFRPDGATRVFLESPKTSLRDLRYRRGLDFV